VPPSVAAAGPPGAYADAGPHSETRPNAPVTVDRSQECMNSLQKASSCRRSL
jgi:hypothetical protein